MNEDARWSDLGPRVISAVVLGVIASISVYVGGAIFLAFECILVGLMVWEVARMFDASLPTALGILAAVMVGAAAALPVMLTLPLLAGASVVAASQAKEDRPLLFGAVLWISLGGLAFLFIREESGLLWLVWLILVVISSDVAGYFAGRWLGGPKFWPAVSPKKTWSGTVAGWIAAGVVGAFFSVKLANLWIIVPLSIAAAFAGQMGDIAQSAVKRRRGVKDSSNLIPGHGGVFDRFDAMLGAGVLVLLLKKIGLVEMVGL
ncbi:MAG: phosphatidate cytidylyltransferase [Pseudomonadota bacterium]